MTELLGESTIASQVAALRPAVGSQTTEAVGWATVDLDRTLATWGHDARHVPDDTILGARCVLVRPPDGHDDVVLLEPSTEGRLAGSLARFGEGYLVRYVIVRDPFDEVGRRARLAGLVLSAEGDGPFGRQRLVGGGPRWGPFLIVASRAPFAAAASTIDE